LGPRDEDVEDEDGGGRGSDLFVSTLVSIEEPLVLATDVGPPFTVDGVESKDSWPVSFMGADVGPDCFPLSLDLSLRLK